MSQDLNAKQQVTQLLHNWHTDNSIDKELSPIIYETMRRISHNYMAQENNGYTLQATELVHEAYEILVDVNIDWENRKHFYAIAANTLRRLLVDRARKKSAIKRGENADRVTFDESSLTNEAEGEDILLLEESLQKLQEIDKRKADIVELYFYAGMTYTEIALQLNISEATVDRDLRFSKAWLASDMKS